MAWCQPGDKPLSEPMMISVLTHLWVIRLQWVKQHPRTSDDWWQSPDWVTYPIHCSYTWTTIHQDIRMPAYFLYELVPWRRVCCPIRGLVWGLIDGWLLPKITSWGHWLLNTQGHANQISQIISWIYMFKYRLVWSFTYFLLVQPMHMLHTFIQVDRNPWFPLQTRAVMGHCRMAWKWGINEVSS